MAMRKKTILKKMAEAINKEAGEYFGAPTIMEGAGWDQPTLCWDGPYDWHMCTCGESLYVGEAGYGHPTEARIQKVVDLARANGYYFEPVNQAQLVLCD